MNTKILLSLIIMILVAGGVEGQEVIGDPLTQADANSEEPAPDESPSEPIRIEIREPQHPLPGTRSGEQPNSPRATPPNGDEFTVGEQLTRADIPPGSSRFEVLEKKAPNQWRHTVYENHREVSSTTYSVDQLLANLAITSAQWNYDGATWTIDISAREFATIPTEVVSRGAADKSASSGPSPTDSQRIQENNDNIERLNQAISQQETTLNNAIVAAQRAGKDINKDPEVVRARELLAEAKRQRDALLKENQDLQKVAPPAAAPGTPAPTPTTIQGIRQQLENVDKAFENVRKKDTEIQEKISGAGGDQAALQKKMNDLEKEKANAATSPDRKTDIDKELQTLKENKAALEKLESERNTAQQEAQRLSDEALKAAEELQRKEKDAYDKFVKANPGKPSYQQEKNKYEAERLLAEARIKDIQTRRTPLENEIRDLERQKASAKTDEEKNKIQQQIDAKKTDLAPMISEQNKYQADVRDAAAKKANAEFREETFIRQAVSGGRALLKSYEMFSGIARLGSLFLTGKNWEEWRKKVDDAFCKSILFGGTKCWQSKICEKYIDTTPGGNSLIARTARGAPTGAAHLAVEKSLPIDFAEEGTGYLYKISYTVTNPNDRNMNYNIKFSSTTKTVKVFQPDKELAPGTSDGKVSSAMLYKKSFRDYTQACLTFNPSIRTWDGRSVGEYCIPISQYKGAATQPFTNLQQAEGTCDDGVQNQRETSTDCGGPCPTCGTTERPKEFEDF